VFALENITMILAGFFLLSFVTDELESKFVQLASSLGLSQWHAVSYENNGRLDVKTVPCYSKSKRIIIMVAKF